MTAEAIARVVADLNSGDPDRIRSLAYRSASPESDTEVFERAWSLWQLTPPTVIDATLIYESLVARDTPIGIYEEHLLAPPSDHFAISYVNQHGNVMIMDTFVAHNDDAMVGRDDVMMVEDLGAPQWETENPVDWARVRWVLHTHVWIGGRGDGGRTATPTRGPVHLWRSAVYEDGTPADLAWVQVVPEYPMEHWDMAHLVLLGAVNFLNCRNVEIVEPSRPRAERRRLERDAPGVKIHTINVFPTGKTTRSAKGAPVGGVPLTSVRGHMAHYGQCCPPTTHAAKGLLFGRLEGRFFIPQHARGNAEHGTREHDYKLMEAGRG